MGKILGPDGETPMDAILKIRRARQAHARTKEELREIKNVLRDFLGAFGSCTETCDPEATRRDWDIVNASRMNRAHNRLRNLVKWRDRTDWGIKK